MTDGNALALINESGLLAPEENATLMAMKEELRQTFTTVQVFRTDTEAVVSVLKDMRFPTPDAKYWQAVREQDVFVTELVNLSYEYRKLQIDIRREQRKLEAESDSLEREAIELEIEHLTWKAALMKRTAHHRVREIEMWSRIKADLVPHLKHGTDDVNAHQLESMRLAWGRAAQLVTEHTPPADARNILGLAQEAEKQYKMRDVDKSRMKRR